MIGSLSPKAAASRVPPSRVVALIAAEVAEARKIALSDLMGTRRTAAVVLARQETMWRAAKLNGISLPVIGATLKRDHSTCLHGVRAHAARIIAKEGRLP